MAMTERNPFEDAAQAAGAHESRLCGDRTSPAPSTRPPRPDALRVQKAAIRKHLHERRPDQGRPGGPSSAS